MNKPTTTDTNDGTTTTTITTTTAAATTAAINIRTTNIIINNNHHLDNLFRDPPLAKADAVSANSNDNVTLVDGVDDDDKIDTDQSEPSKRPAHSDSSPSTKPRIQNITNAVLRIILINNTNATYH